MADIPKKTINELERKKLDELKTNGIIPVAAGSGTFGLELKQITEKIESLFFAVYGVDTYSDVMNAIYEGKKVFAFYNGLVYNAATGGSDFVEFQNIYISQNSGENKIVKNVVKLSNSGWSSSIELIDLSSGGSGDFNPNGSYDSTTGNTLSCNKVNGVKISFAQGVESVHIG